MDFALFLEKAGMDGASVKVSLKDGDTLKGRPIFLDEGDEDYLGFAFRTPDGGIDSIFLKDIESAERIEA
jgi:hypothetical protein